MLLSRQSVVWQVKCEMVLRQTEAALNLLTAIISDV